MRKHRDKFDTKAIKAILIGYAGSYKGYKLYNITDKYFFISKDVIFYEHIFPFKEHVI